MQHRLTLVDTRITTATETITLPKDVGLYAEDAIFILTVFASSGDTDTMDITIQHSFDQDAKAPGWDEFVGLARATGTDAADTIYLAQWNRHSAAPETESRVPNTSLAAGNVVQGPAFPDWRVVSSIGDNDDPSFTWRLDAVFWHQRS